MRSLLLLPSVSLFLVQSIKPVFAAADVNLLDFPAHLGAALGIGAFAGGILATIILAFAVFGMLGVLTKKRPTPIEAVLIGVPVFSFATAIGWFPVWPFVVMVLFIAFMFGKKIVEVFR